MNKKDLLLPEDKIQTLCEELVSQATGIVLNDFMKKDCDAASLHTAKQIVYDLNKLWERHVETVEYAYYMDKLETIIAELEKEA